jgi:hypothetical protein
LHSTAARANRLATSVSFILAFIAAAILAGCGGGGGTPNNGIGSTGTSGTGTTGTGTTTTVLAHSLQLLAGATTLPSVGTTPVALTAIVLDTNNNALAGQTVTFVVTDAVSQPSFINNVSSSGVSDSNGLVTASLNLGANKTNRIITVTATVTPPANSSGTVVSATVNVAVVGTTINVNGPNALVFGQTLSALSAVLKDSGGNPIPGQTLTITSANGNTVSPATATTDVNGTITFSVTGTAGGNDTITVSGAGATGTLAISVNSANFLFQAPATNAFVVINTPQILKIHWDNAGANQIGQLITFSATRGTLSSTTAITDVNGNASVTITSTGAGPSTVTATGPAGTPATTLALTFVTTSANKVSIQAAQASVPVNIVGQTTNQTALTAIVRDINDNLVQGAVVDFTIVNDPSGGSLSAPSAVTNVSGSASVQYIAGSTSSGAATVVVSATVVSVNGVAAPSLITATVSLTVNGQSLFIRMATDNQITSNIGSYTKSYYALVTDAAGNPLSTPVTVVFSLQPTNCIGSVLCGDIAAGGSIDQCTQLGQPACPGAYGKGAYVQCTALNTPYPACIGVGWQQIQGAGGVAIYNCLNEDVNFNGILDPGEDYNHNGKLDPGNVAGVNGTAQTDTTTGIAIANITYVKGFANWSAVQLTATITVAGTEYIQSSTFILPIAVSDVSTSTAPPGGSSPFGINPCIDPN